MGRATLIDVNAETPMDRATFLRASFLLATSAAVIPALADGNATRNDPTAGSRVFRAGAHAQSIDPPTYPVIVNGMFEARQATRSYDPLHARCLVLDDGTTRVAIAVVDSCILPRQVCDEAKRLAAPRTGIPADRILISATHNHSSPAAAGALGCPVDEGYAAWLPGRIAEGIVQANRNLAPAHIGWTTVDAPEHTHSRRWLARPDRLQQHPFGGKPHRGRMHPQPPMENFVAPSGPDDPEITMLSMVSPDGRPIALLASYAMHYFAGGPLTSADWCGHFCRIVQQRLAQSDRGAGASQGEARPVPIAIMAQGTSGDTQWIRYHQPDYRTTVAAYSKELAEIAVGAYEQIEYQDWAPLRMAEAKLTLDRRVPDEKRLHWARSVMQKIGDRPPRGRAEIYAREQILLLEEPRRELVLQAIRVGQLGITAIPNEVYALTGLKLKAQSPLPVVMNVELANGGEGYIPPPEQHFLGGYSTWEARTAALEAEAEPRIVDAVLGLLEEVAGAKRKPPSTQPAGAYAEAVLADEPAAYWRLDEMVGPRATDASGHSRHGRYELGVAFYLPGPQGPGFCGEGIVNRAAHFAGGQMIAPVPDLGDACSVELWCYNGMPGAARDVAGYLLSIENANAGADGSALHLGISGKAIGNTGDGPDRLMIHTGDDPSQAVAGRRRLELKTWYHVVLVVRGSAVTLYLDGQPELETSLPVAPRIGPGNLILGGRATGEGSDFAGLIDEVAVYPRALSPTRIDEHYRQGKSGK